MSHTNGEAGDAVSSAPAGQDAVSPKGRKPTDNPNKPDLTSLIRTVAELWPIFTSDAWRPHRPLALGIDKQMIDTGIVKPWEAARRASRGRSAVTFEIASGTSRTDGSLT
jgi:hypothetical protein